MAAPRPSKSASLLSNAELLNELKIAHQELLLRRSGTSGPVSLTVAGREVEYAGFEEADRVLSRNIARLEAKVNKRPGMATTHARLHSS